MKALSYVAKSYPKTKIIATTIGPDSQRFVNDLAYNNVFNAKLFGHIPQKKVFSIFKIPKIICIDQFGEQPTGFSGLFRESVIHGVPLISDHNQFNLIGEKEELIHYHARSIKEINTRIDEIMKLSVEDYLNKRIEICKTTHNIYESINYGKYFKESFQARE